MKPRTRRPRLFLSVKSGFVEGRCGFAHSRGSGGHNGQICAILYSFDSKFRAERNGEVHFLI